MSPLWPDFAIARIARATAVKQGLIDHVEKPEAARHAPRSRRWREERSDQESRRPIRRPVASYAL